jgi:hypothetical protein
MVRIMPARINNLQASATSTRGARTGIALSSVEAAQYSVIDIALA